MQPQLVVRHEIGNRVLILGLVLCHHWVYLDAHLVQCAPVSNLLEERYLHLCRALGCYLRLSRQAAQDSLDVVSPAVLSVYLIEMRLALAGNFVGSHYLTVED